MISSVNNCYLVTSLPVTVNLRIVSAKTFVRKTPWCGVSFYCGFISYSILFEFLLPTSLLCSVPFHLPISVLFLSVLHLEVSRNILLLLLLLLLLCPAYLFSMMMVCVNVILALKCLEEDTESRVPPFL